MNVEGLIVTPCADGFAATARRLDAALTQRGISPMLRLDHAAAAEAVGLTLAPVLLILFGDPRVGTKLMQEKPTAGIDLPLKLLVWEDKEKLTWVGYNDPAWIRARHGLPAIESGNGPMDSLLRGLALSASGASPK